MSYSSTVLADSPLFYARLGESSGTTMNDSSGNGHNGTYNSATGLGATSLIPGDSSNTAITSPTTRGTLTAASWLDVSSITIETTIKLTSTTANRGLVAKFSSTSNASFLMWIDISSHIGIRFYNASGSGLDLSWGTALSTGTAYHIMAMYTSGDARLYVNGSLVASSSALTGNLRTSTVDATIGYYNAQQVSGVVDDVSIYGSALSSTQASTHHQEWLGNATISGGLATEADTALSGSVTVGTFISGGLATEADAALAGAVVLATFVSGQLATEVDSALAGAVVSGALVSAGIATESDTALAGAVVVGIVVAGGLATESDTALAGSVHLVTIISGGLAAETDSALAGAVLAGVLVTGGLALESDSALAGSIQSATIIFGGIAVETDSALGGTIAYAYAIAQANRAGGRVRVGLGIATYEPPVVEAPAFDLAPVVREATHAFTTVTMDGTMPTYEATIVDRARDRDRVLVGGKDVTFFRGVHTPTPDYMLISPLMYGSGSLTLPQVNPLFEHLGTGALKWLRKGKPVIVQRVNAAGSVVATDYRGIIVAFNLSGAELTLELGGQAAGRAALRNKQIPLFRGRHDAGFWGIRAVAELRVPTSPPNGPDTGIVLHNTGGMSQLDYINQICSMAVTASGDQWSIMPVSGVYKMALKDTATIHATAYFDDARIKPDLRRDIAEEPNRVFATGVRHDGQRVRFGAYPGLKQGAAPDYPMNDNSAFGVGTLNVDTDTGDGVSVMLWKLQQAGYLDERPAFYEGYYDTDAADAIKDLQDDRGVAQTGIMNLTTWRALFDLDVTGYSTMWSKILPAAQLSSVREWDRTGNGSLASRNPDYDPHVVPVDRNIDVGAAFSRQRIRKFARSELSQGDNWVGTVDLNFGLIDGEHNPGDPLVSADVKQARGMRPGMNVWAPLFDGGTLFHVSGVQVSDAGKSVRLTLDTKARDTMKVWQVIQRNRESRQNPARAWINQYRSSTITKDGLGEWDEVGGLLDDRVRIAAGSWTVFPVVAGQEGTVSRLRFQVQGPNEFAMAITGRYVSPQRWNHLVPAPLAATRNDFAGGGDPWYEDNDVRDALRDKFLLYAAGTHDEPCGYESARAKLMDGSNSGAFLTGVHNDDAGFSYRTFSDPVLWVAIWVNAACAVLPGRVMWNQLEVGS